MRPIARALLVATSSLGLLLATTACTTGDVDTTPLPAAPASPTTPLWSLVEPVGEPRAIVSGLDAPWSVLRLPDGSTLISERDKARLIELEADGSTRTAAEIDGVEPSGEGGLLGLAYLAADDDDSDTAPNGWLYAYYTAADDNRVVRMPLTGKAGAIAVGDEEVILSGLAKAGNHNGGRIAFGPDGMLYVTVGDAGDSARAQDRDSLNGKILRLSPTGDVPDGNPFGTLVWSLGHRNPQGIAWDSSGRMWASEFGQDTWDELNIITPGANYGWPTVEGAAHDERFTDPVAQWATDDASPSGLAIVHDTLFMASLRGERLWTIDPTDPGHPVAAYTGEFGRLRDAVAGPDGSLWFLTNNTDGRGDPADGDDRLLQVELQ